MMQEMTAEQFDDWIAAYELEPWGEERGDMQMARIAWAVLQKDNRRKVNENKLRFVFESKPILTAAEFRAKSMRAMIAHGGGPSYRAASAARTSRPGMPVVRT